jgi:hypothetical protein
MPASPITGVGDLSVVAQILLAALPLAALVLVGALVFFWMLWDHQRRLMIIARGGSLPPRVSPERLALTGVVSVCVGGALVLFVWATRGFGEGLLIGVVPAAAGAAILVTQRLARGARSRGGA